MYRVDKVYELPKNFHERVLELEKMIEWQKEKTPHGLLQSLLVLYSVSLFFKWGRKPLSTMDTSMTMKHALI
jgi:hypothetical protein